MPRWLKIARGIIGTGLTFAVVVGVVGSMLGLAALVAGELTGLELLQIVAKFSVVSFIVGVGFSGVLALAARGRSFDGLSLRFVTTLGAGVGLLYFLFISVSGSRVWSAADAIANVTLLLLMGGGLPAGALILARRAGRSLKSAEESPRLAEGRDDATRAHQRTERTASREARTPHWPPAT